VSRHRTVITLVASLHHGLAAHSIVQATGCSPRHGRSL